MNVTILPEVSTAALLLFEAVRLLVRQATNTAAQI